MKKQIFLDGLKLKNIMDIETAKYISNSIIKNKGKCGLIDCSFCIFTIESLGSNQLYPTTCAAIYLFEKEKNIKFTSKEEEYYKFKLELVNKYLNLINLPKQEEMEI